MTSLITSLPFLSLGLFWFDFDPELIKWAFIASLFVATIVAYNSTDERMDDFGASLSLIVVIVSGGYVFTQDFNIESAFVLYASLMTVVGIARKMPKK